MLTVFLGPQFAFLAALFGLLGVWFAKLGVAAVVGAVAASHAHNPWAVLLLIPAFAAIAVSGEATRTFAAMLREVLNRRR